MGQWRWTLSEEFKNGKTQLITWSTTHAPGAMDDVANTVEYILDIKKE